MLAQASHSPDAAVRSGGSGGLDDGVGAPLRLRLITLSGATALGSGHPHCPTLSCQSGAKVAAYKTENYYYYFILTVPSSAKEELRWLLKHFDIAS